MAGSQHNGWEPAKWLGAPFIHYPHIIHISSHFCPIGDLCLDVRTLTSIGPFKLANSFSGPKTNINSIYF